VLRFFLVLMAGLTLGLILGARMRKGRRRRAPQTELEGLTRDELYARAKAAGVAGRGRMSKSELAAALGEDGQATANSLP
jgi:hypothetical protein